MELVWGAGHSEITPSQAPCHLLTSVFSMKTLDSQWPSLKAWAQQNSLWAEVLLIYQTRSNGLLINQQLVKADNQQNEDILQTSYFDFKYAMSICSWFVWFWGHDSPFHYGPDWCVLLYFLHKYHGNCTTCDFQVPFFSGAVSLGKQSEWRIPLDSWDSYDSSHSLSTTVLRPNLAAISS
jgi:hypothetical protein